MLPNKLLEKNFWFLQPSTIRLFLTGRVFLKRIRQNQFSGKLWHNEKKNGLRNFLRISSLTSRSEILSRVWLKKGSFHNRNKNNSLNKRQQLNRFLSISWPKVEMQQTAFSVNFCSFSRNWKEKGISSFCPSPIFRVNYQLLYFSAKNENKIESHIYRKRAIKVSEGGQHSSLVANWHVGSGDHGSNPSGG